MNAKLSFFLFLALAALLNGQAAKNNAPDGMAAPRELRVGSEVEFFPYAFADREGRAAGFSVELIEAVSKAMGLRILISTGTWDEVWKGLTEGRLDVLPIVAKMPERDKMVDFSLPHTETFDAFFVRKGSPLLKSLAEANGKTIVVMRSDAAHHELLARNFQGRIVPANTIPEGLLLVSSGLHDAFLCSKLIGIMMVDKHDIKGLTAGPPIQDYKRAFSFAVRKGDEELLEKLNQGLLIVKSNGEYNRIYEKWLTAEDPWKRLQKYLKPIGGAVIAIIFISALWIVLLQLQIRQRKESEARLRTLYASMNEGLVLHDILYEAGKAVDYLITDVNPAFERITGISRASALGKRATELYRSPDPPYIEVYARVASGNGPERFETYYPPMDKHFLISVFSPGPGKFVTVFSDISERMKISAEREKLLSELERRARELAVTNQELEAFSYSVSHDLRNPLNAIMTNAEVLKIGTEPGTDRHISLSHIVQSAERMAQIITDLLMLSGISRRKIECKSVNLSEMVLGFLSDLKASSPAREVHVQIQSDVTAEGDPGLLRNLVENLCRNAWKYTSRRTIGRIEFGETEKNGRQWFFIRDNGVGFDMQDAPKLFTPYERLQTGQEFKGTGIGLAIVKRIVKRHGGEIFAEGERDKGAAFYFHFA